MSFHKLILYGLNLQQTSMYFDAYLRGRNGPNNLTNPAATPQPPIDSSSKIIPLRPPTNQTNFMHNKPATVFQESKVEPPRPNSSAHIFVNDFRKVNPPSRSPNGCAIPSKPEINFSNNYVSFHPNRQHMPDQQKYICLSPLKNNSRTSAGLIGEEMPAPRFQYRRSDSINELKGNQIFKEPTHYTTLPQRQTIDGYSPLQNSRNAINSSPIQSHYNTSVISQGESRVKLDREPIDTISFTYREEERDSSIIKQPYSYRKVQKAGTYFQGNHFDRLNNTIQFESEKKRNLEHSNSQNRQLEDSSYKSSAATLMTPFHEGLIRKDSTSSQNNLDKRFANSRMSDIDKSIEKDIELLKYTSRKTEEILDRELSKNTYLNQLFEQKGIKVTNQDRIAVETKEKKEVAAKNIQFERDIEDKNKEIFQKNKEITQKSKVITEKNKQIESLSSQLRLKLEQIGKKQCQWQEKDKKSLQKIALLQQQLSKTIQKCKITQQTYQEQIKSLQKTIQIKNNQFEQSSKNFINANKRILLLEQHIEKREVEIEDIKLRNKELQQQIVKTNIQLQQNTQIKDTMLKENVQKLRVAEDKANFLDEKLKVERERLIQYEERQKLNEQRIRSYQEKALFLQQKNKSLSSLDEGNKHLQAHAISLTQQLSIVQQQKLSLQQEIDIIRNNLFKLQENYSQISCLLLLQQNCSHQIMKSRVKEIMEIAAKSQGLQMREILKIQQFQAQRMHQEHLERRHQELSRELKRIGNRLAGASTEAQQGWRLLRDLNNEIVVSNLTALNEKYKHLMQN